MTSVTLGMRSGSMPKSTGVQSLVTLIYLISLLGSYSFLTAASLTSAAVVVACFHLRAGGSNYFFNFRVSEWVTKDPLQHIYHLLGVGSTESQVETCPAIITPFGSQFMEFLTDSYFTKSLKKNIKSVPIGERSRNKEK